MLKTKQRGKTNSFQNIIAKVMKQSSNTNIHGDMSFAEMQAKRDEILDNLYNTILPVSNHAQSQQIVDIMKLGLRGNEFVDAMPIMALGDVMAYMRQQVRQAIKQVRSYDTVETVIELDQARAYQHYEDMVAVYFMVNKAYYTLYKRFMVEANKPQMRWNA